MKLILSLLSFSLFAQGPANTVVVYSSASSDSVTLANYYKTARSIPAGNMCPITPPNDTANSITQAQYESAFRDPIKTCITNVGRANVYYVVIVWVRNLVFNGSNGVNYAIDSFLQDPWETITTAYPIQGSPFTQPTTGYYAVTLNTSATPVFPRFNTLANYRLANPWIHLFSVWRIDGDSTVIAQGLIDKAIAAETTGLTGGICSDTSFGYGVGGNPAVNGLGYNVGQSTEVEWDMYRVETLANQYLPAGSFPVQTNHVTAGREFGQDGDAPCTNAAFLGGWYGGAGSHIGTYSWVPGAIGIHVDSYSLGDFRNPFNGQTPPGTWVYQELKNGLTVSSGSINEQYTYGSTRAAGVLWDLLQGANVGDAFLRNTRWSTRWRLVMVGDPLYKPFRAGQYVPLPNRTSQRGVMGGRGPIQIR
jgi:uncharacterized protein (TIGR03790 family)